MSGPGITDRLENSMPTGINHKHRYTGEVHREGRQRSINFFLTTTKVLITTFKLKLKCLYRDRVVTASIQNLNLFCWTQFYTSEIYFSGFFGNILDNMKQEFSKNKELQESLRKFREDAKKLEDSQDLKDARRKFESIEGEKSFYSFQFSSKWNVMPLLGHFRGRAGFYFSLQSSTILRISLSLLL